MTVLRKVCSTRKPTFKYAVKYLKVHGSSPTYDHDGAVRLYARGYYYDAKRRGLLHLTQ